jgi:glutathione S-transferase
MQIYGIMLSPFMARVVLAARFKGIKHKIAMPKNGTKSPEFLKLNPLGKMPTMKDGSTVLFESAVILEYLEAKYKKKRIVPTAAKAAVQVRQLSAICSEYIQPAIFVLWRNADPKTRDQAAIDANIAILNHSLDTLEEAATVKPYMAGAKFTMADCYAVPAFFFLGALAVRFGLPDPFKGRKKLTVYMAKAKKNKLLATVLEEMDEGLKQMMAAR